MELSRHVRRVAASAQLACLCELCRGFGFCTLGREVVAFGGTVASGCLRFTRRNRECLSVGQYRASKRLRQFQFRILGSHARLCLPQRREPIRNFRYVGQWLGMDFDRLSPLPRLRSFLLLSRLFSQLFRRQPLRDEGRLASHRELHASPKLPQLVSASLPVRLRQIPLRGGLRWLLPDRSLLKVLPEPPRSILPRRSAVACRSRAKKSCRRVSFTTKLVRHSSKSSACCPNTV